MAARTQARPTKKDKPEAPPPPTIGDLKKMGPVVDVKTAAAALGISIPTAYRLIGNAEIPSIKVGASVRVPTDWLIKLLQVR